MRRGVSEANDALLIRDRHGRDVERSRICGASHPQSSLRRLRKLICACAAPRAGHDHDDLVEGGLLLCALAALSH
jgi:hypothetical protein